MSSPTAAIVTVGTELTQGLRLDTNTAAIAAAIARTSLRLHEAVTVPDDEGVLAATLARLLEEHDLVVVTGGLGPTHDDVTREAAATALGTRLVTDEAMVELLRPAQARHQDPVASARILSQALVLEGASVIPPGTGTAPGQVLRTGSSTLALLPGPPDEMRPMLEQVLAAYTASRAAARTLGVVGMTESDAQIATERALEAYPGVALTVLATPGHVVVVLLDESAGERGLADAAEAAASALGDACYSTDGSTLAETVVRTAREAGATIATAESCTGGMVAAAITDVPGASDVFAGSIVAYANKAKRELLGIGAEVLEEHGAVSAQTAEAMAEGARDAFEADLAVSATGIAGPTGGTPDKPAGLVWFGLAGTRPTSCVSRRFPGDRTGVRTRATMTALDLLRRELGR